MSRLVTLATYGTPLDAQLARARLESEGIECFVLDEHVSAVMPFSAGALGGVRLQVNEADEPRAIELLKEAGEERGDDDDDGHAAAEPSCPRCGSPYIRHEWTSMDVVVTGLLLGLPRLWLKKKWHCQRCSYAWPFAPANDERTPGSPYRRSFATRAERPVFRLPVSKAGAGVFWGVIFGVVAGAVIGFPMSIAALTAGVAAGFLVGRSLLVERCSACGKRLSAGAASCPQCKGKIAGTIRHASDHFAAQERALLEPAREEEAPAVRRPRKNRGPRRPRRTEE